MCIPRTIYQFDDFRVDTGSFLLMKDGRAAAITPTVFRILLALLEQAGQVVMKDDLIRFVWPDSFVEEGNLNRNISTLRKALGERPCDHRFIETIPKTGYRFVAPVRSFEYQPPTGSGCKVVNGCVGHIVGRDRERKELRRAYELAQQGHGGLVCISGDVGLGKTALVDAFLRDLVQDGHAFHLARGRSSESLTETEPVLPWIEALGSLAREQSIRALMHRTAPAWHREISHAGSGAARRMKRELLDFFTETSLAHPLIVVLDDFQWADIASVDLVAFLATRLESTRTLLVICYRPAEMRIHNHPFLQLRSDLLGRHLLTEIQPALLQRKDVEKLLALSSRQEQFRDNDAGILHARSEGNPLFIQELARATGGLPESLRSVIRTRLDRLSTSDRELLAIASAQGREFDSAILSRSLGRNSEDVEERLRALDEVHGLIQRIREEELPDGRFTVRYRFAYGLYQEICYASLVPRRKACVNASTAEALLTYYGN